MLHARTCTRTISSGVLRNIHHSSNQTVTSPCHIPPLHTHHLISHHSNTTVPTCQAHLPTRYQGDTCLATGSPVREQLVPTLFAHKLSENVILWPLRVLLGTMEVVAMTIGVVTMGSVVQGRMLFLWSCGNENLCKWLRIKCFVVQR